MKKALEKTWGPWLMAGLGCLLIGGAVLLFFFPPLGMEAVCYVALGIGCGLLGGGGGQLLALRAAKKRPEQADLVAIERKDERNIAIDGRAKAAAFSFGFVINSAILLLFTLLGIPAWAILTLCGGYALTIGAYVFFLMRYQKTM